MNLTSLGEGAVAVVAAFLAFSASEKARTSPGTSLVVLCRLIITAAAVLGTARYSNRPTFVSIHFFFRQLANLLPVVVTALSSLRLLGSHLAVSSILDFQGDIMLGTVGAALVCFFTKEEAYGKPIQVAAIALLAASVGSGFSNLGGTHEVLCLAAALTVFIARDVLLRAMFSSKVAEPMRRATLAVALLLLWSALG